MVFAVYFGFLHNWLITIKPTHGIKSDDISHRVGMDKLISEMIESGIYDETHPQTLSTAIDINTDKCTGKLIDSRATREPIDVVPQNRPSLGFWCANRHVVR